MKKEFVFVHGMSHGAWCWELVQGRLEKAGWRRGRTLLRGLAAAGNGAVQYPAALEHARWMTDLPAGDPRVTGALARLTPQPLRPWVERVDMQRFYAMNVPRTYIRCLGDAAIAPAKAAEYAARLGVTPIDLDCAHGPMLSEPRSEERRGGKEGRSRWSPD